MQLSDGEWKAMRGVWARGGPATARDVLDEVADETGWSYSTVRTLLGRLVEKGALETSRRGNTAVYTARISEADARRSAVRQLVDRAFDGTLGTLVQHLARGDELSDADRERLRAWLDDGEEPGT